LLSLLLSYIQWKDFKKKFTFTVGMVVKRSNQKVFLANGLLIIFLFTTVLSNAHAFGIFLKGGESVVSKQTPTGDLNFPFEENEKQEEEQFEAKSFFVCLHGESELFALAGAQEYKFYARLLLFRNSVHAPLYLFNKTLLI
jgi:hypothetical protein